MTNLASDARTHQFSASDRLLLDANIWLAVQGPKSRDEWDVKTYSGVFKRLAQAGCRPFIDATVLGEYVGVYLRIRYEKLRDQLPNLPQWGKPFRRSPHFAAIAGDAAADAKRVLSFCQKTETAFAAVNVFALVDSVAQGKLDFGDLLIAETCRTQSLTLVTNDADFKGLGIPILTANGKLLS